MAPPLLQIVSGMKLSVHATWNEKGAVLPLTFFILVLISGLLLALLAISGEDTVIARNHADGVNALAVAEAGIARAIDTLNGPAGALPQTLFTAS